MADPIPIGCLTDPQAPISAPHCESLADPAPLRGGGLRRIRHRQRVEEGGARLVSDADANGEVVLPKSKNPRRPAVGLKTARGILDKKNGD